MLRFMQKYQPLINDQARFLMIVAASETETKPKHT